MSSHPFGEPTGYELLHEGNRYPPKAVIGLAYRHLAGRILRPDEFSGGEAPGQANHVLRSLGFTVVRKERSIGPCPKRPSARNTTAAWGSGPPCSRPAGRPGVAPARLRELGIYRRWPGASGSIRPRTGDLTPGGSGITVGVLHTGQSYADDLAEDCIVYHYPSINDDPGRDAAEVEATKQPAALVSHSSSSLTRSRTRPPAMSASVGSRLGTTRRGPFSSRLTSSRPSRTLAHVWGCPT